MATRKQSSRVRSDGERVRQKMVDSAITLMQRQGYHGTGLIEIVKHSGTPRGSIYHHFPGGKDEVVIRAIQEASQEVVDLLEMALRKTRTPGTYFEFIGKSLSIWMRERGFEEGCPIAVLTLETAPRVEPLRAIAEACYQEWMDSVVRALERFGVPAGRRESLAQFCVGSWEGAIVLCRAKDDTAPMRHASIELGHAVSAAVVV